MLKAITYKELIKTLREAVIEQSGIHKNRVLNALSARGTDLDKLVGETDSMSYDLSDSFILFELTEDDNSNNYVLNESDTKMSSISSFKFHLMIYGNACHIVSQKILARLKIENIVMDLHEKGIYITSISYPESINEFINNTLWPRCDMNINIQVRFEINKLVEDDYFPTSANDIDMIIHHI